jgi:glucose/arabinose dehydrogenase
MRWLAVLALVAAAAIGVAAAVRAQGDGLHLVRVAAFSAPVYATAAPGDPGALYVVEQAGRILVLRNGHIRATPFLDIRSQVQSGGEQGLLSVAFDPAYARTHRFYVDYTDRNGDTRIMQYRSDGNAALPSSAKQLVFVKDFAANHNGGQLQFGPDGLLYWGNGDGGGGGDPEHNGQSLARPFAKIMRLNVNAPKLRWRVYAYGLRNPWRFSFDRANGDLYIADVGQNAWEEVDYLKHGTPGLVNFGWNRFEGRHVYDATTQLLGRGPYVPPIAEYPHADGCSVSGGYVYRGRAVAAARGRYFYGDYCTGAIWSLRVSNGKPTSPRREPFSLQGLSSFGQDSSGELYAMSVDSGVLYRLAV